MIAEPYCEEDGGICFEIIESPFVCAGAESSERGITRTEIYLSYHILLFNSLLSPHIVLHVHTQGGMG